jgi:glycine betaine catabolism B
MKAILRNRQVETDNVESFFWETVDEATGEPVTPSYRPGQFLRWVIEDPDTDERGNSRFFSIASSPTEPLIRLTTKFNADRSSSFKARLKALQPGSQIKVVGPLGDFVLPKGRSSLVLVAGGIGITPFRSMIKYLDDSNIADYTVRLLYACRTAQDFVFKALFDEIRQRREWLTVTYMAEESADGWTGETGRLDGNRILGLAGQPDEQLFYFSGPEPMIELLHNDVAGHGIAVERLKTDYFPGYSQI